VFKKLAQKRNRPKTQASQKMSSAVETDRGRTRGRGEVDDDQDKIPEHLKCIVCLGEGRDRVFSKSA